MKELPIEERQKILDGFTKRAAEGSSRFNVQCKMEHLSQHRLERDQKPLMSKTLGFLNVEREGFYDNMTSYSRRLRLDQGEYSIVK